MKEKLSFYLCGKERNEEKNEREEISFESDNEGEMRQRMKYTIDWWFVGFSTHCVLFK